MTPEQAKRLAELREAAHKLIVADYFVALGVARAATPDDVKKAFVEAAKTWHPDRVPPGLEEVRPLFSKLFARLELARATLSDPGRRARYIEEQQKPQTAASAGDISAAEATLEFRKAEALLKKHDVAGAEGHLRRAVQLAPANTDYQILLVWLQAKPDVARDRLVGLEKELTRLIGQASTSDRTYYYRGQLRKRLDRLADANADFVRAVELNPSNVDATREIRIYTMRQERGSDKHPVAKPSSEDGFFKKLFKR